MSLSASAKCPHELRPGTTVCLHCRRAARDARIARRNRTLRKLGFSALGLAACAYAGAAGWDAYRRGAFPQWPEIVAATASLPEKLAAISASELGATPPVATPATRDSAPSLQPSAKTDSTPALDSSASVLLPVVPVVGLAPADTASTPPPAPSPPVLEPIVANGRTDLHDGIYALRSGDTVTVHFDTPEARTRRAEKFELIVRATLPLTYGVVAEELLASTSPGTLAGDRDVVAELPGRGIHLRTSDGRELSIWPETRPGRDGPIVVSYRATRAH